jgi:hypothetical protein
VESGKDALGMGGEEGGYVHKERFLLLASLAPSFLLSTMGKDIPSFRRATGVEQNKSF